MSQASFASFAESFKHSEIIFVDDDELDQEEVEFESNTEFFDDTPSFAEDGSAIYTTNSTSSRLGGQYEIIRSIGKGSFGVVSLVSDIKQPGLELAMKQISCESEDETNTAMQEAWKLRVLNHENLTQIKNMFVLKNEQTGDTSVCMIMEFFGDGDMDKLIKERFSRQETFSEMELLDMMLQLASGVEYLHSVGLIHRDLKPGNVFVKKQGDKVKLVIGDFGLARQMESSMANTIAGTLKYMPPEAFTVKQYGLTADVWSLGVIFYELVLLQLNKILYVDAVMSSTRVREEVRSGITSRGFSDELANMVCSMLDADPTTRLSAHAVKKKVQYLIMRGPAKPTLCQENCGTTATMYCNECGFFYCDACQVSLHKDLSEHTFKPANLVRMGPFPSYKVYACGKNNFGQLGLGHNQDQPIPNDITDLEGKGIVSIVSGADSTVALTASGEVFSWGYNTYGNLGVGHNMSKYEWDPEIGHEVLRNRKVRLDIPNLVVALREYRIVRVAAGSNHFLAQSDDDRVFVWGDNSCGQIGLGELAFQATPTELKMAGTSIQNIFAGGNSSFVTNANGDVYIMGGFDQKFYSQKSRSMLLPRLFQLRNIVEASVGKSTFAITLHGRCYGWGNNAFGQLTLGDRGNREDPIEIAYFRDKRIMTIGQTQTKSLFLSRTGAVYVCGGKRDEDLVITELYQDIARVTCHSSHYYTLSKQGKLLGWRDNTEEYFSEILSDVSLSEITGTKKIVGVTAGHHNTFLMIGTADDDYEEQKPLQKPENEQKTAEQAQEDTQDHDEFYIDERLDDHNWQSVFRWAQDNKDRQMIPHVVRFIVRQFQHRKINRDTIISLKQDLFKQCIRSDYFALPEADIFQMVVDWYNLKIKDGAVDVSDKNAKDATYVIDTKSVAKYLRLGLINNAQKLRETRAFPFISLKEYAEAFEYAIVPEEFTEEEKQGMHFRSRRFKVHVHSNEYFIDGPLELVYRCEPLLVGFDGFYMEKNGNMEKKWDCVALTNQQFTWGYVYVEFFIEYINAGDCSGMIIGAVTDPNFNPESYQQIMGFGMSGHAYNITTINENPTREDHVKDNDIGEWVYKGDYVGIEIDFYADLMFYYVNGKKIAQTRKNLSFLKGVYLAVCLYYPGDAVRLMKEPRFKPNRSSST